MKRLVGTILKKKAEEALPTAMTGAVAGTGLGIVSGGLLGTLVGGPIGGALIGTASSFIVKSEKFQNWMFGEDRIFEDENGNQTIKKVGGVISAEIQEKLGAAKNHMIGGAAVGMGVGAFTGGGMLGMLVGGPVAGALMELPQDMLINLDYSINSYMVIWTKVVGIKVSFLCLEVSLDMVIMLMVKMVT